MQAAPMRSGADRPNGGDAARRADPTFIDDLLAVARHRPRHLSVRTTRAVVEVRSHAGVARPMQASKATSCTTRSISTDPFGYPIRYPKTMTRARTCSQHTAAHQLSRCAAPGRAGLRLATRRRFHDFCVRRIGTLRVWEGKIGHAVVPWHACTASTCCVPFRDQPSRLPILTRTPRSVDAFPHDPRAYSGARSRARHRRSQPGRLASRGRTRQPLRRHGRLRASSARTCVARS